MMFGTAGARTQGYLCRRPRSGPASTRFPMPRASSRWDGAAFRTSKQLWQRADERSLESFTSVLDFGCGCGRTLRWLDGLAERAYLAGSDIDGECVSWCAENIRFAHFSHNELLPPLEFADETFDLVYALSVFTHMNESAQHAWLAELQRVTRRGAVLLLSTHGPHTWPSLPPRYRRQVELEGFLWVDASENAYHSPTYVRERWSAHFDVLDVIPTVSSVTRIWLCPVGSVAVERPEHADPFRGPLQTRSTATSRFAACRLRLLQPRHHHEDRDEAEGGEQVRVRCAGQQDPDDDAGDDSGSADP